MLETLGGVNVGNIMQRPEKLTVFAAKDLVALDELKFEGKLFSRVSTTDA